MKLGVPAVAVGSSRGSPRHRRARRSQARASRGPALPGELTLPAP